MIGINSHEAHGLGQQPRESNGNPHPHLAQTFAPHLASCDFQACTLHIASCILYLFRAFCNLMGYS
jgi:hypothetical protein